MPDKAMPDIRLIALDLDGTLLTTDKRLTERNRLALQRAAEKGIYIVPTTGRFYNAMPRAVRELPFLQYAITINGACVECIATGEVLCHAEIPHNTALELMAFLDGYPVIYDCYMRSAAFMTADMQNAAENYTSSPHYLKMVRDLRKPVPELKAFLREQGGDVQKIQFLTKDQTLKQFLWRELENRFPHLAVASAIPENVEVTQEHANKGEALLALAEKLGLRCEQTMAFGDGMNDLSMIRAAGVGVAMANAEPEVLAGADMVAPSNDEDGVAAVVETLL